MKRWQHKFLEGLERGLSVTQSCRAAGISRQTAYELRNTDDTFKESWDQALDVAIDVVGNKLRETALAGKVVAMIFYLKSARPEKYRETRALMSPKELEQSLEKEIEARVSERVDARLRELGVVTVN